MMPNFYSKISTKLIIILLLSMSSLAMAAKVIPGWQVKAHDQILRPNSGFHFRYPGAFHDDVLSNQKLADINLTLSQKHQALVWELSENQEKRYLFLMQNRSGKYYQNKSVTPVEILGINARDNTERSYFAAVAAKQEAIKIAKELAFNAAYHQAFEQIVKQAKLPVIHSFNTAKYAPDNYHPVILQPKDKLLLFTGLHDPIRSVITTLLDEMSHISNVQLDIYFVGKAHNKTAIEDWAKAQSIPVAMVTKQTITLNVGDPVYKKLKDKPKLPVLYRIRDGEMQAIDLDGF